MVNIWRDIILTWRELWKIILSNKSNDQYGDHKYKIALRCLYFKHGNQAIFHNTT
jgi:hypothetical protein